MKVVLIFNWWNADQWPIDLDDGHETWLMLCDANNNALETGWKTKKYRKREPNIPFVFKCTTFKTSQ